MVALFQTITLMVACRPAKPIGSDPKQTGLGHDTGSR